ncbi:MAG: hypothetical protein EPN82_16975 [Bacteroidetes bacterium]|nr:MAG: hypothetical protein EPN82_16975 [Bacteroidota bacterium]
MKKLLFILLINCSLLFAQNNWELVYHSDGPAPLWALETYGKNIITGAGNNGFFFISKDTGQTWEEVYIGTDAQLWGISFIDESNIWICGHKGTIIKYDSKENKYFDFAIDSKYDLKAISFIDNNTGLAGSDNGVVFRTSNGGKTWDSIFFTQGFKLKKIKMKNSEEGYILCCPLYVKVANKNVKNKDSRIYKTFDGGLSWKILTNINGEDINNILFKNDDIWIVGNDGMIIKSSDGGITWEWFKKNFSEHIWNIYIDNENLYVVAGWSHFGVGKSSIYNKSIALDFSSEKFPTFMLAGNGEYLFTEYIDGEIGGFHEIWRKKLK